jgi:hypothetical protein
MRRALGGDRFWWLSMGLLGVVGTLVILPSRMGWSNFKRHFRFDPKVGSNISFGEDAWCGESSLKDMFPGLFNIARFRGASIADNVERSNGSAQWNIVLTRLLYD